MDKMDLQFTEAFNLNTGNVVGQLIQLRLVFAPVVVVLPVSDEFLDIAKWCAVIPACIVKLIGEIHNREFLLQAVNFRLWDRNVVWPDI